MLVRIGETWQDCLALKIDYPSVGANEPLCAEIGAYKDYAVTLYRNCLSSRLPLIDRVYVSVLEDDIGSFGLQRWRR
jgi:hypothetical protein